MTRPTEHEVLAAVLRIHAGAPHVLTWQRARAPDAGRWALPGGRLGDTEDVETSVRRQLAEKVDLRDVTHVEQLSVFSDPHRGPAPRRVATAFVGLVPSDADPAVPADTAWHPVDALPPTAFDHGDITRAGLERLRAKLSYTNIGFALAPEAFTISELRRLYAAALGHRVSATNLQRVLTRITLIGAVFLGVVAILPFIASRLTGVSTLLISATSMLIVVGVAIDTMRQLEAQLQMRNYEGFIQR